MSTAAAPVDLASVGRRRDRGLPLLAAPAAVAAGVAIGVGASRLELPLAAVVAAGAAAIAVLSLALVRYHAAVGLAFALLGLAVIEPAPADAVLVTVVLVALTSGRFSLREVPTPVLVLLAVFAALNLMSAVQVEDAQRAAVYFAITLYLMVVAVWLPTYVTSAAAARVVARAYVAGAVASAAAGVAGVMGLVPGADLLAEGGRARALFQDPNVFGPFLIPALLIVLEEILRPRLLRGRLLTKSAMLAVLALGVLFSFSRGAWLNLAVALLVLSVVLILRPGGARHGMRLLAVTLSAAAVATAIVVATGSAGFLTERARPQAYDTERFSGQRAALRPAQSYPFGAGPGQFEGVAGISAHSSYARALGEQGFPGLLVVLALFALTLGYAVRNAALGRSTFGIGSAALLAAWSGQLASSAFVDTLHWRHLWLVAALIWVGAMLPRRRAP